MRQIILDFSKFSDRREVHDYLESQFAFPDYYGHNLDALYDCLTDPMEETTVYLFTGGQPFEEGFLKVFREAAEDNASLRLIEEPLP